MRLHLTLRAAVVAHEDCEVGWILSRALEHSQRERDKCGSIPSCVKSRSENNEEDGIASSRGR